MTNTLPTWRDGPSKDAIIAFVTEVTDETNPDFMPAEERIAVFDNDGTLWCEKPMYIQLDYFLRGMAEQAKYDPKLREEYPWKAAWEKDFSWLGDAVTKHYQGDDTDLRIVLKGIVSMAKDQPVEEVEDAAREFVSSQLHPELGVLYKDCIYQPMVQLLRYLEENGFTPYIVSGGGRDFMRGFSAELYNIPRERVIGSTVCYRFMENEGGVQIVQQPELDVIDDGPGKPVQIWNIIGRRPVLAAGNANGDIEMLKLAESSERRHLNLLLLHDDAEREYAYTRGAENALALAEERDWTIISMQNDWQQVFQ